LGFVVDDKDAFHTILYPVKDDRTALETIMSHYNINFIEFQLHGA